MSDPRTEGVTRTVTGCRELRQAEILSWGNESGYAEVSDESMPGTELTGRLQLVWETPERSFASHFSVNRRAQ
jgi:hypothetical protein